MSKELNIHTQQIYKAQTEKEKIQKNYVICEYKHDLNERVRYISITFFIWSGS